MMLRKLFGALVALALSAAPALAQGQLGPGQVWGNPTVNQDLAQPTDPSALILSLKAPVIAATTANITLSGAQTIDGVAVVAGNRVLVKNQSTASQNGIYVAAAGAWSLASDWVTGAVVQGTQVFVAQGTANANTVYHVSTAGAITVGSTSISFSTAQDWNDAPITMGVGTLLDQQSALSVTATMPTTPSATQFGINFNITGAGSAAQASQALHVQYSAGYTGASLNVAVVGLNNNAGTGSTPIPASGSNSFVGNNGLQGNANATTTGFNVGTAGLASAGNVNAGVLGLAQIAKNSATNIGVVGSAINTGTSPVMVGGWFSLNQTTVPTTSAALIADNGAQSSQIALFNANNVLKAQIASGGSFLNAGYIRVGDAVNAPTNTTAGDITGVRLSIGNQALGANGAIARFDGNVTGGTIAFGVGATGTMQSDVTASGSVFNAVTATQAAAFTENFLIGYRAAQGTIGAGSTVTNNVGFAADSSITGGTNNFGFYSNIGAASARWNFFANGTANNAYAGNSKFGAVTAPTVAVDVAGSILMTGTINNVTITQPASSATLTIANTKSAIFTNSLTVNGNDATLTFGAAGTYTTSTTTGNIPTIIAQGTSALNTALIASAACATVVTTSATGTATTDVVDASFNGDPTGVTGYAPSTGGILVIYAYPSANNVNFKVCNNTAAGITPGAITLNWKVVRK